MPWLAAIPLVPALGVGFLLDDFVGLQVLMERGWPWVLQQLYPAGGEFLRPLGLAFVAAELAAVGPVAWAFHAFHLALFGLAAWLSGRLAARLGGESVAGWAVALALAYPGRLEVAVWVAGVFDLLALLLVLAALLVALAAHEQPRPWKLALLGGLAFLAPLAKESAYCLVLILLGWEVLGVHSSGERSRRWWTIAAALAGTLGAVLYRLAALGGVGGYAGTGVGLALQGLARLPLVLVRAALDPVNPWPGALAWVLAALCGAAFLAAVILAAIPGSRSPHAAPLVLGGLVVLVAGLLPALPYLHTDVAWHHSRYLGISGLGVALIASAASLPRRGRSRLLVVTLLVAWCAATVVNLLPWLAAARARDVILASIEEVTRAPGRHAVWVAGPINDVHGAHLLGGDLQAALRVTLPARSIEADSEFFQRYQGRPTGPPTPEPGVSLHLLHYHPDSKALQPFGSP